MTEVATFRSDGAYSDGRHPDAVRFSTSPEEDVKRRDFTINGMMLDPGRRSRPRPGGRQQDLQAGLIRAIGDPGGALHRRQTAHVAGRALCRALRL